MADWRYYLFSTRWFIRHCMWTGICGHVLDIPIIYTDPNAVEFDKSYIQGPDTVIVPRSYFQDSSGGQNWETYPTFQPSKLQISKPKSNRQSQDIENTTELAHNDSSEQTSQPSTDTETAYEPMPQTPSRQSDNPSTETILQNKPSHSRSCKYNLRLNPNPNYSEIYRYWCVQNLIPAHFVCHFHSLLLFFPYFRIHIIQIFSFSLRTSTNK